MRFDEDDPIRSTPPASAAVLVCFGLITLGVATVPLWISVILG